MNREQKKKKTNANRKTRHHKNHQQRRSLAPRRLSQVYQHQPQTSVWHTVIWFILFNQCSPPAPCSTCTSPHLKTTNSLPVGHHETDSCESQLAVSCVCRWWRLIYRAGGGFVWPEGGGAYTCAAHTIPVRYPVGRRRRRQANRNLHS